jgi:hypothetical protein
MAPASPVLTLPRLPCQDVCETIGLQASAGAESVAGILIPGMLEEFSKSNSRDQDQWMAEFGQPLTVRRRVATVRRGGRVRRVLAVVFLVG